MGTLFQLGPLTIDAPGPFNATDVAEEFGGDFAVKPVVGAQQPREFVGEADHHFTISGKLFPFFYQRQGMGTGLDEMEMLREMAASGEAQVLVRGDGAMFGFYFIEKVSKKDTTLGAQGIGREISYDIALVKSPNGPSAGSLIDTLASLFS